MEPNTSAEIFQHFLSLLSDMRSSIVMEKSHIITQDICPIYKYILNDKINFTLYDVDGQWNPSDTNKPAELKNNNIRTDGTHAKNTFTIALVQELYTIKNVGKYKILLLNGIKCVTASETKFLAAILFNTDLLQVIAQIHNERLCVISALKNQKQMFFASVYLTSEAELEANLPGIKWIIADTGRKNMCIGGAFNVRSTLWYDIKDDNKAHTL